MLQDNAIFSVFETFFLSLSCFLVFFKVPKEGMVFPKLSCHNKSGNWRTAFCFPFSRICATAARVGSHHQAEDQMGKTEFCSWFSAHIPVFVVAQRFGIISEFMNPVTKLLVHSCTEG